MGMPPWEHSCEGHTPVRFGLSGCIGCVWDVSSSNRAPRWKGPSRLAIILLHDGESPVPSPPVPHLPCLHRQLCSSTTLVLLAHLLTQSHLCPPHSSGPLPSVAHSPPCLFLTSSPLSPPSCSNRIVASSRSVELLAENHQMTALLADHPMMGKVVLKWVPWSRGGGLDQVRGAGGRGVRRWAGWVGGWVGRWED